MKFFSRIHKAKVIAILLLGIMSASLLSGCADIQITIGIDDSALSYLEQQDNLNVGDILDQMDELLKEETESTEDTENTEGIGEDTEDKPEVIEEERITIEEIRYQMANNIPADGILTKGKVTTLMESEVAKLRGLFANTIVIGNSRARSILDSGILTQNEVVFKWAAHVDEMMDTTLQGANLHRDKVLFMLGVNDLGYYIENTEGFKRDYIALIDAYREINPDATVYIQEIIPINEAYRFRWYNMDRVTDYNAVIREICEEEDCVFVSSVYYAIEEFLRDDGTGAHYNYQYHIYWAQTMANQMNLWEDVEWEEAE